MEMNDSKNQTFIFCIKVIYNQIIPQGMYVHIMLKYIKNINSMETQYIVTKSLCTLKRLKVKASLYLTLCDPMDSPWDSPDQNTGVGSCSLLQGMLETQESNQGLLHCRWILYQLSYQGSPQERLKWKSNNEILPNIKNCCLLETYQKLLPFRNLNSWSIH